MITPNNVAPISRRKFLKTSFSLCLAAAVGVPDLAGAALPQKRSLSFYHTHTRQHLEVTYAYGNIYDADGLRQIDHFLRDFRTGEIHTIDLRLMDMLWKIQQDINEGEYFEVISGYRSPGTNNMLRNSSTGVAKKSLHMQGRAIDIRLPGVPTKYIQQCAVAMECGGVGYYPKSDFVHLDTGDFRTW